MTYRIAEKNQATVDPHWGHGTRYTFTLVSAYPNGNDDHFKSTIIVGEGMFNSYGIGDKIVLDLVRVEDGR